MVNERVLGKPCVLHAGWQAGSTTHTRAGAVG